ncbi:MAG: hypothetical protein Q8M09_11365 [Pseudomonadota bacterium]|jgi:hypothetical protein|nr:hypothetical protein [Pseudomonadota bacterium]MDP2352696.1 hypothetical protein [Pseudomonadota bacterium]
MNHSQDMAVPMTVRIARLPDFGISVVLLDAECCMPFQISESESAFCFGIPIIASD